ncbi:hypothetical protein MMC34_001829 [Xylographa carneopallida]|nr:hypothetical protein [Xylographa carneopallida]
MRVLFTVPFFVAQLVPLVTGQTLANIPQCAQSAAISSLVTTGCAITNYTCFCDDKSWISGLLPVVMSDCDAADFQTTVQFAQQLCNSVGVTLSVSGVSSAPSTAAASGTAASSSAMSMTMATSTLSSSPVMPSTTGTASVTSASASAPAVATASASSALSPAGFSWLILGLAVFPALASIAFIFFGSLV